jgi:hypothetical protein
MEWSSLDENPACESTHASFRLLGDALRPDEVSAALGLTPTRALSKGQVVPFGRTTRIQPTGLWWLSSEHAVESTSLERHLIHLMEAVEPAAQALDTLRNRQELRADFFCYWLSAVGHGGPAISPATLARIAGLDAALSLDFYDSVGDSC